MREINIDKKDYWRDFIMAAQDFDLSSNRAGTICYGRTYKLMTIGRPPLPFGPLYLFIICLKLIHGRMRTFFWPLVLCALEVGCRCMFTWHNNKCCQKLGDDHLILNGGVLQILSGQHIYSQLLMVLTEIKFILHIEYSTDVLYFLLFSGRPSLFIFYGTMAIIFIFKLFGPEYLFTNPPAPCPQNQMVVPLWHSKRFYETAEGRGEGRN